MINQSKILTGILLYSLFNFQAHAELPQADHDKVDQSAEKATETIGYIPQIPVKSAKFDPAGKGVQIKFSVLKLPSIKRAIDNPNMSAIDLYIGRKSNIDFSKCPPLEVEAQNISSKKNMLGIPTMVIFNNVNETDVKKAEQAQCARATKETLLPIRQKFLGY